MIHAASRACITYEAATRNLRVNRINLSRCDLANLREPDAIFITEWQVTEKVLKRANAALCKQLRAARSHSFEVHHFGCGRDSHPFFISPPGCLRRGLQSRAACEKMERLCWGIGRKVCRGGASRGRTRKFC